MHVCCWNGPSPSLIFQSQRGPCSLPARALRQASPALFCLHTSLSASSFSSVYKWVKSSYSLENICVAEAMLCFYGATSFSRAPAISPDPMHLGEVTALIPADGKWAEVRCHLWSKAVKSRRAFSTHVLFFSFLFYSWKLRSPGFRGCKVEVAWVPESPTVGGPCRTAAGAVIILWREQDEPLLGWATEIWGFLYCNS